MTVATGKLMIGNIVRIGTAAMLIAAGVSAPWGHLTDAHAADTEGERAARAHFRLGETHYAAGRYGDALSEYQAGYDVEPLPGFLVNIAQCQRRMGELARARATYGKFVLVAPDSPLVPEVHGLIEELDRLIAETETAKRRPSASDTAGVKDGADILPPSALDPAPPPAASARGADLTAARATSRENEPDEPKAQADPPSHRRWWFWGAWGVIAAAAATTALILTAPDARTIHDGSLGTLRR